MNILSVPSLSETLGALRNNRSSVPHLHLRGARIDDEGAVQIADALMGNSSLESLDLSHNRIGPEGVQALVASLRGNDALTCLNLAINKIGCDGAARVAELVERNSRVNTINLSFNDIGDDGGIRLLNALQNNMDVISMDVSCNAMDSDVSKQIEGTVAKNKEMLRQSQQFVVTLTCLGQVGTELSKQIGGISNIAIECNTMGGEQLLVEAVETETIGNLSSRLARHFGVAPGRLRLVRSDGSIIGGAMTRVSFLQP